MSSTFEVPIQRSRGMRDLLPPGMRAFRRVEDAFRGATARWGYEEVRTPTIETYSLFTSADGLTPAMLSRVYTFLDWDGWSGDRVVLRPDSTIPVARLANEAALGMPARMCYVQNVFRFSATGDREDWQIGIEYLGAPGALADLEVVAVACETLDTLGMRPTVRLGHVGVTRALAQQPWIVLVDLTHRATLSDRTIEHINRLRGRALVVALHSGSLDSASLAFSDLSVDGYCRADAGGPASLATYTAWPVGLGSQSVH